MSGRGKGRARGRGQRAPVLTTGHLLEAQRNARTAALELELVRLREANAKLLDEQEVYGQARFDEGAESVLRWLQGRVGMGPSFCARSVLKISWAVYHAINKLLFMDHEQRPGQVIAAHQPA